MQGFNRRIDKEFDASPQTGLAIYPEGHRSTDGESLPLKRGMLHYAFSRRLPVQVVIGANKEAILSEKHQTARFRQTVAVGYSSKPRTLSLLFIWCLFKCVMHSSTWYLTYYFSPL